MPSSTDHLAPPMKAEARAGAAGGWLFAGLLALVWLPAFRQWSYDWSTNPQYYYGWAVPLLSAYLIYERVEALPRPQPFFRGWLVALVAGLAFFQIPLRWFGEANSDWWPVWWAYGFVATGVTLGLLLLTGGVKWVIALLYPILFLLTAIPWPTYFEIRVVQGLMGINAAIAAEIVSALGAPAIAMGNVIEVSGGILGVNEACSGIRSLQSTLMASLFLAGLYRLRAPAAAMLVVLGVLIAFVCNLIRTTFLTYEGATKGVEATEKWHDAAGFAILGVVLVCLFLISQFFDRRSRPQVSHG